MKSLTTLIKFKLILLMSIGTLLQAQIVNSEDRLTVTLSDGVQVVLFGKSKTFSDEKTGEYYALPAQLKLGTKPDGVPEFLFLKFTTDEANPANQGAILHMLMEWGLTPAQRQELENILASGEQGAPSGSKFMGFMDVEADGDQSFRVISATLSNEGQVITSSRAPVLPGSKIAAAARMDKIEAQLLAATFEKAKSITDLSVELNFKYTVQVPGAKGFVKIDYSKLRERFDSTYSNYNRRGWWWWRKRTHTEYRELMDTLLEEKTIDFQFEAGQDDERVKLVQETFMDYFLDQMTSSEVGDPELPDNSNEDSKSSNPRRGRRYTYNSSFTEKIKRSSVQTFNLDFKFAVTRYFSLTGNLASWYDGVRYNPACVVSENLNDPFFDHREIVALLDLDTEEIFKEEINHGTISIRKERSNGEIFQDELLFDRSVIGTAGVKQSVTYARMDDKASDAYEYKVKWSVRGNKEIEDRRWQKGDWKGITLLAPIRKQIVTLEGDPEEMKENDITRAVMQIRYLKFGQEMEENIPFSVGKELRDDGLVEKAIFLDRETKGYVYRIILNHKTLGKIVSEWEPNLDDYVYFSIPQNVQNLDAESAWQQISEVIARPSSTGEVRPENEILKRFTEILGILADNK